MRLDGFGSIVSVWPGLGYTTVNERADMTAPVVECENCGRKLDKNEPAVVFDDEHVVCAKCNDMLSRKAKPKHDATYYLSGIYFWISFWSVLAIIAVVVAIFARIAAR